MFDNTEDIYEQYPSNLVATAYDNEGKALMNNIQAILRLWRRILNQRRL